MHSIIKNLTKIQILYKIQELRDKKQRINSEIKELLSILKQFNKDKMTDKQRSNIQRARKSNPKISAKSINKTK